MSNAPKPSTVICTKHAWDRVRDRYGITDKKAADQFVSRKVNKAEKQYRNGDKTHFVNGDTEIIVANGNKVVTIYENKRIRESEFTRKAAELLAKEARKFITNYERALRKIDIEIAENNLNRLKARNPKTKTVIEDKMQQAMDRKDELISEINSVKESARDYGVEIGNNAEGGKG